MLDDKQPFVKFEFNNPFTPELYQRRISVIKSAHWFARRGLSVFPCHAPLFDADGACVGCTCEFWRRSEECKSPRLRLAPGQHCHSPGKCPLVAPGKATTDPATIDRWFAPWRVGGIEFTPNIGINTNLSDLLVLDVDRRRGGDAADYLRIADQRTVTVLSGSSDGSLHLHYRRAGLAYGSHLNGILHGVDLKGAGAGDYVVAPPSIHRSGQRYQFEPGYGVHEVGIADIPPALHDLLGNAVNRRTPHPVAQQAPAVGDLQACDQWAVNAIKRSATLSALYAGDLSYTHDNSRSEAVWMLAKLLAKWKCDADQIERVLRASALNYDGKFDEDRLGRTWLRGRIENAMEQNNDR